MSRRAYKNWPEALTRLSGTLKYYNPKTEEWRRASPMMAAAYAAYDEGQDPPSGNPWRVHTESGSGSAIIEFIAKPGMVPLRIQLVPRGGYQ